MAAPGAGKKKTRQRIRAAPGPALWNGAPRPDGRRGTMRFIPALGPDGPPAGEKEAKKPAPAYAWTTVNGEQARIGHSRAKRAAVPKRTLPSPGRRRCGQAVF